MIKVKTTELLHEINLDFFTILVYYIQNVRKNVVAVGVTGDKHGGCLIGFLSRRIFIIARIDQDVKDELVQYFYILIISDLSNLDTMVQSRCKNIFILYLDILVQMCYHIKLV